MAYPKTFKRKNSKDRIVHNDAEEALAVKDGFEQDPPEGPGGEIFSEHRTDPVDPRTGSRTQHPPAAKEKE